jgi:LacI family transcriptional regulator
MKVAVITESSSEYGRRLVDGVAAYARTAHDWRLAWHNPEAPLKPDALHGCSGIIARIANDEIARCLIKTGLPVVDVFCRRDVPEFFGVNSDHAMIGRLAADHFIERRYVNFAFAGFLGVSFSDKRFRAFASRIKECGFGIASTAIPLPSDQSAFFNRNLNPVDDLESLRNWLAALPKPSAVFAANDLLALAVSKAAHEAGLSVPEDIAVLGVDDDRLLCAFADSPISSIDPNAFGIGYTAARMLSAIMKDPPK